MANLQISELPAASRNLLDTDQFALDDTSNNSKKITGLEIQNKIRLFGDNLTDLFPVNSGRNINLLTGGLKDTNVITAINLGDIGNIGLSSDFTAISIIGALNEAVRADGTKIDELTGATVNNIQDYINYNSSVNLAGDPTTDFFITDAGSGQINISSGKGFIKTTDSIIGDIVSFDYASESGIAVPNDNTTNWVYLDYNAGSPQVGFDTSVNNINLNTEVVIGRVYRSGTTLTIFNVGQRFSNYRTNDCKKDFEVYGAQRASGLILGETGTRNVTSTAGILYCAHNRVSISAIDTSGADTFDTWNSSASTTPDSTGQTQYDNANYWNGASLIALTNNRYGTRFFYIDFDGNLHMQYGTSNTVSIATAENEVVPIPPIFLRDFAIYIGRIVIQEGDSSATSITSPFLTPEAGSIVTNHSDLANLTFASSGHTGTINTFAGFDGAGVATNYTESNYALLSGRSGDILNLPGNGDLLILGTNTGSSSPRATMKTNNSGYDLPSAADSNSNGDKYVFWNSSQFKGAIGMNANEMWFQSMGTSGSDRFRFYTGNAGTPSEVLRLGESSIIFNESREDRDFFIRKVTSGDAYKYDFGLETHAFVGDVDFNGILSVDTIVESTTNNGINIEGLHYENDYINKSGSDSQGLTFDVNDIATFTEDLNVTGNLFVNGDKVAVDSRISTSDYILAMNFGESGSTVTSGISGIETDRGSGDSYVNAFFEANDDYRIGIYYITVNYTGKSGSFNLNDEVEGQTSGATGYIINDSGSALKLKVVKGTFVDTETIDNNTVTGSATISGAPVVTDNTQAVSTREDSPTNQGLAFWNSSLFRFDTNINLTWDDNNFKMASSSNTSLTIEGGSENDSFLYFTEGTGVKNGGAIWYDGSANDFYIGTIASDSKTAAMKIDRAVNRVIFLGEIQVTAGILKIFETSTPSASNGWGKLYTKSSNKFFFQDGGGTEHEVVILDSTGKVDFNERVDFLGNIRVDSAYFGKRTASAIDYNPSILTTDYMIVITDTSIARAVTISTEDIQSGSVDNPRIFIVKDESGNAGTNNITVSGETGNIDGVANAIIGGNYESITMYADGTNLWII